MATFSARPCSLGLFLASSIPGLPLTPESPPRDSVAAFVPFLWEEKPGISKQYGDGEDKVASSKLSSEQPELLQLLIDDLDVLPLPIPPRLQKLSGFELNKLDGRNCVIGRNHEQKRSVADSPSKKRQPRHDRADDDPFLRAIQACTARNGPESKGARKLSRSTLLQKFFEIEGDAFALNKTNNRASHPARPHSFSTHSFSTELKPAFDLNVRQGDPRQLLEERRHRTAGQRRYTDQRRSSTPRTKSGVMLGSCLGCRNPEGYEPSAILAMVRAPADSY